MLYLAMTAAEFRSCRELPPKIAWMACHFSPYGTGLTNLPPELPPESLLILNDRTPIHGHDSDLIFDTIAALVERFRCCGVLLDLQRDSSPEAATIAAALQALPCPVAVSSLYAGIGGCPVFLPPVPLLMPPEQHFSSWAGRDIWLDVAAEGICAAVTATGCTCTPHFGADIPLPHRDPELLIHYRLDLKPDTAIFTLKRTKEDVDALLEAAKTHGATHAVGLYQEWMDPPLRK